MSANGTHYKCRWCGKEFPLEILCNIHEIVKHMNGEEGDGVQDKDKDEGQTD